MLAIFPAPENIYLLNFLLLVMDTSPWGLSEIWGGWVPTSDIDHSGPRLRRLLLLFSLALPPHLFLLLFFVSLFSPSFLPPPHLYPFLFEALSIFTRSPPPLPVRSAAHLDVVRTRRPSASAACPCAPRRVPGYRSRSGLLPPFPSLSCTQVHFFTWGVSPSQVPPHICLPSLSPPISSPNIDIVRFFCPCRVAFLEKARGQGASTPSQSQAFGPLPPILGYSGAVQDTRIPSPFPLLPPRLVVMFPSVLVEDVSGLSLEFGVTCAYNSRSRGWLACKT